MNKKKKILILLSVCLALISAVGVIGIAFNPMPTLFQEFYEGSISNTSYTLNSWSIDIIDPSTIVIYLNGSATVSSDYTFLVSILDLSGYEVQNATRTISLTSGIPDNSMFTLVASEIVSKFVYIDVSIER